MSSLKIRDQKTDHLLTPENSVVIIIDYQNTQIGTVESSDKYRMVQNTIALVKLAKVFKIPIVVSTVNVKTGINGPTIPQIAHEVKDLPSYDRTTINAWEDAIDDQTQGEWVDGSLHLEITADDLQKRIER